MTSIAQFEEKTFEKYFGHEVARYANYTYSPGQFGEATLGFDEAFDIPFHRLLWKWHLLYGGHVLRKKGISLSDYNNLLERELRNLPKFKLNLFVQYKRPEYVYFAGADEWPLWEKPYYRYCITDHQQMALVKLSAESSGRAAVVYASPAFWMSDDLFAMPQQEK